MVGKERDTRKNTFLPENALGVLSKIFKNTYSLCLDRRRRPLYKNQLVKHVATRRTTLNCKGGTSVAATDRKPETSTAFGTWLYLHQ